MADIAGLNTKLPVLPSVSTGFTASGPFKIEADGLQGREHIIIHRKGPSGDYKPLTNDKGPIRLGANPNSVLIDIGGDYQVEKTKTASAEVYCSWSEV